MNLSIFGRIVESYIVFWSLKSSRLLIVSTLCLSKNWFRSSWYSWLFNIGLAYSWWLNWITYLLICWLICDLHWSLLLVFHLTDVSGSILQEFQIWVNLSPVCIKFLRFFFINVIIMVSFFNILAYFFPNYFSTPIVEHSLFSYSVYPLVVFISLLSLRDSITLPMFSHVIFEIFLPFDFAIRTNSSRAGKALKHICSFGSSVSNIFMNLIMRKIPLEKLNIS